MVCTRRVGVEGGWWLLLGKRLQRGKQPLSGRTRPDPQEPKARGWSDGAMERRGREAKAREAREAAGLNAGHPARCRAPREPISVRHLRRPNAPRTRRPGGRVGTSLSSRFSSLLPGAHVGGAAWGCAVRGVGRPRPPGPQPPRRGPGAPSSGPSRPAEIRGTQTYSVGGTSREPTNHAPPSPAPLPGGARWVPIPLHRLGAEWGEEWKWGWREEERRGKRL